jgi:arylformamidase
MLYDISPVLSPRLAVWPGDTPLAREVLSDMRHGANITLSSLRATVHLGAHADAPGHYGRDAAAIDQRSLDYYLGPCVVIHVNARPGDVIGPEEIKAAIAAPRILFATGTYPDAENFRTDFAALSPKLVDWLHDNGVKLVGIDTPSVDPFESKDLAAHRRFLNHDMAILEGLVLSGVPEGTYELIALPLKLEGFDASPVRAVLRTIGE